MCGQIVRKAKSGLIVIVMEHCDGRIVPMCVPPPPPLPTTTTTTTSSWSYNGTESESANQISRRVFHFSAKQSQAQPGLHGGVGPGLDDRTHGSPRGPEGALRAVLGEVEDVPKVQGQVVPCEGVQHGIGVGGGVEAREAPSHLRGQPPLGREAHGKAGPVQAADGV